MFWFGLALLLAVADWGAVARRQRALERLLKPATLLALLAGVATVMRGPHDPWQARFLLAGLLCSLVGDLFLLPGSPYFLPGLAAFWLAHLCYVIGLNFTWPPWPAWGLLPLVVALAVSYDRWLGRGLRARRLSHLRIPVILYSIVLGAMLFSAWATLFRPEWTPLRRGFVIAGATLFVFSDGVLGWKRFVAPASGGRLRVMVSYHLGQLGLAASVALLDSGAVPLVGALTVVYAFVIWAALHSLLASRIVKAWFERAWGALARRWYRLGYVLFAGFSFLPVLALWITLPDQLLYQVAAPWRWLMLWGQGAALVGLAATLWQTDVLEFSGLSRLWQPEPAVGPLQVRGLYCYVRHPMYLFGMILLWLTPVMTVNLFALYLAMSLYFYVGSLHEEQRMLAEFGEAYARYRTRTPMWFPHRGRCTAREK